MIIVNEGKLGLLNDKEGLWEHQIFTEQKRSAESC